MIRLRLAAVLLAVLATLAAVQQRHVLAVFSATSDTGASLSGIGRFDEQAIQAPPNAARPHAGSATVYLIVPGVTGQVITHGYTGAIQLLQFSFSAQASTFRNPGISTIQVQKEVDVTSPVFSEHYFDGKAFTGVTKLDVVTTESGKETLSEQILLGDLTVASDAITGAGGAVLETLTFSFSAFNDCNLGNGHPSDPTTCASVGVLPTPSPTPTPVSTPTPTPTPVPTSSPTPSPTPTATGPQITEYALHSGQQPRLIRLDVNGNMWFAEYGTDSIGTVSTSGVIQEFPLAAGAQPVEVVAGPNSFGAYNFVTENGASALAQTSPADGSLHATFTPSPSSGPFGESHDATGNLWFTEHTSGNIGEISNPGDTVVHEYPIPLASAPASPQPLLIVEDPNNTNMYFTDARGFIGTIVVGGSGPAAVVYPAGTSPWGIAPWTATGASSPHYLWFTDAATSEIGSFDPAHPTVTPAEYPLPGAGRVPQDIAVGPDNALWFVENGANKIGRFDPTTHVVTEYLIPTAGAKPYGIVKGPDNASMWFTECGSNKIGTIGPIQAVGGGGAHPHHKTRPQAKQPRP